MPKKLHQIKVTERDIKALGFRGSPDWHFAGAMSKVTSPESIGKADAMEISLNNGCIAEALLDRRCTVLDVIMAAYSAGRADGAARARFKVRQALGIHNYVGDEPGAETH